MPIEFLPSSISLCTRPNDLGKLMLPQVLRLMPALDMSIRWGKTPPPFTQSQKGQADYDLKHH
jgi:hypothetical protein